MKNCLVVQHVAPESAWVIGDALERAGVAVDVCRVDAERRIPVDALAYKGVVVMGGPMSAVSDEGFPSRRRELALLVSALERGIPTLGVCLGAQLLALAAGGTVGVGASGPEVGWAPVELSAGIETDALFAGLPRHIDVLHWHGDTYELPPRSVHLAASARYRNQAFRVGAAAWGIQFHMEVTADAVDGFVAAFGDEAVDAPGGVEEIRRATPRALEMLRPWQDLVFDRFTALVSGAEQDGSRGRFADISTP